MKRESFVFYSSWMEAIQVIPTEELRNEAISAIIMYGLGKTTAEDWKSLNPFVQSILMVVKPILDKNQNLYENAKKGGRPKKNSSESSEKQPDKKPEENQSETNPKPTENQIKENQNQNEGEVSKHENQAHVEHVYHHVHDHVPVPVHEHVPENSLSPCAPTREGGARLSDGERERALFFLLFERKVRYPQKELAKFEAYYTARGWKDGQGRDIVNPVALLETWDVKPQESKFKPLKKQELEIWRKIIEVFIKHKVFATPAMTEFHGVEMTNDEICRIYGSYKLKQYLGQVFTNNVYNETKTAISAKKIIHYAV